MLRTGVDLGGTKIEAALVDRDGTIVTRQRVPTPGDGYAAIIDALVALVRRIEQGQRVARGIGIGIPGAVSPASGLIKNANTTCLIGRPLVDDLTSILERPLRVENDANCMVLSEVLAGAAAGADPVFGVIIGTGTGGGCYVNGALVRGANAIAGEWGHNPVPFDVRSARDCYCGKQNCVETFLSGAGLLATHRECCDLSATSVEDVVTAANRGDAAAARTLQTYGEQLSACLAVVCNMLDPQTIVLAGGLSNLPDVAEYVQRRLGSVAFSDTLETRVVRARFGDSSGVRGAACLWPPDEVDVM